MKNRIAPLAIALVILAAPPLLRAAEPAEITTNPAALVTPGVKAADLTVYGAKLGDSIDKIHADAVLSRKPSESLPDVIFCTGKDVSFLVYKDRIVQIVLGENLLTHLPPYDPTRLQVALGKADLIESNADAQTTTLTFLTLQMKCTITGSDTLRAHITSITLYAP